jgi:AcrR family transcriptional regulator
VSPADQRPKQPTRHYRSQRRSEAAAATRSAILDAARRLFLERGYSKVTVPDIADEASIAVPTVYASTGGKAAVLGAIISDAMRDPIVDETLAAVDECQTAPEVLRVITHGVRTDNERYRKVIAVMRDAAASDHTAAEILAQSNTAYRQALAKAADRILELGALKRGLTRERAVDALWFFLGHHAWTLLVSDQHWSWDETERWLGNQLSAALL